VTADVAVITIAAGSSGRSRRPVPTPATRQFGMKMEKQKVSIVADNVQEEGSEARRIHRMANGDLVSVDADLDRLDPHHPRVISSNSIP